MRHLRCRLCATVGNPAQHWAAVTPIVFSQPKLSLSSYSRAKLGLFYQEEPVLHNPYSEDTLLQRYLQRHLPSELCEKVASDLHRFGTRITTEIENLHRECEDHPPYLVPYSAWGRKQDRLTTTHAWKKQKEISAKEGLISIGYDNTLKPFARLYQFAKLYLYFPSAGLFSCPLAATDGHAKVLNELNLHAVTRDAFDRLTTRDPSRFWTSGQWMTERKGGSDVAGGTETLAFPQADGTYALSGYKWFTSVADADVTLTLARCVKKDGIATPGTKGLSLFFLHLRDPHTGRMNNMEMIRLKEKLGTHQLPTAEMLLDEAVAHRVSAEGRGMASMGVMLNITRLYNATHAIAAMRRIVNLARDYSHRRVAFGKKLIDHALHAQTLSRMELETRACFLLTFEPVRLLGLQESGQASERESIILRLLVPIAKLYTGKLAVSTVSEGLEAFGGMGYLEDTGLPSILRDAQLLPIWEGTTNVLSLDVLRVLAKEGPELFSAMHEDIACRLQKTEGSGPRLERAAAVVVQCLTEAIAFAQSHTDQLELAARHFAFRIAHIYCAALLIEQATSTCANAIDEEAAVRWSSRLTATQFECYDRQTAAVDRSLLLEGYAM